MRKFLHLIYFLHVVLRVVLRLVWELDATHKTHFFVGCFSLAFIKKIALFIDSQLFLRYGILIILQLLVCYTFNEAYFI